MDYEKIKELPEEYASLIRVEREDDAIKSLLLKIDGSILKIKAGNYGDVLYLSVPKKPETRIVFQVGSSTFEDRDDAEQFLALKGLPILDKEIEGKTNELFDDDIPF